MGHNSTGLPAEDGRNRGPVLDWLSVTFPTTSALDLAADLAGGLELRPGGLLSYDTSAQGARGGLVAWNERTKNMGVHLVLSSKCLHLLGAERRCATARGLLREVVAAGGKATRLDIALDDYTGAVSTQRVYRHLRRGHMVSRFRAFSRYLSGSMGEGSRGRVKGDTLYFGSRKSETFMRVYDKAAEAEVAGPWTRCEAEWKGRRAAELARRVSQGENPVAYVRGMIEFKDTVSARSVSRMKRALPADWWLDFLDRQAPERLSLPRDARSLESVTGWLEHQVAGALALVNRTLGPAEVAAIADRGKRPMARNREYLRIAAEYAAREKT